jgi:iron-sulfur cluster assembly accessory protein
MTNPEDARKVGDLKSAGDPQGAPKAPAPQRGIRITERAALEVLRVIEEQGFERDATWVRVGAKGGGCSGFTYVLDFDLEGPTEFDLTFEEHGVRLIVDKKSEFFMGGTVLDFNDALLDRGFVFKNPAATGSCGCGSSFSV